MVRTLSSELSQLQGQSVSLAGWVHRIRDLGRVRFLILRDRCGLKELQTSTANMKPPDDLIRIIADEGVAVGRSQDEFGTVYSNVACLGKRLIWFAYDGLPASRVGTWHKVDWPW